MLLKAAVGALLLSLHLSHCFFLPLKNKVLCSSPFPSLILEDSSVQFGRGEEGVEGSIAWLKR